MQLEMEENNYPNLNKICRLCLIEIKDVFSIFQSELSIPLRIMACTTLEVKESDNLPPNICKYCRVTLEKFYLFRKKCQIADSKLRKHIRQINLGKISRVFQNENEDDEEDDEDIINSRNLIEYYESEERYFKEIFQGQTKLEKCTQTEKENFENNFVIVNYENNENKTNFQNKIFDDELSESNSASTKFDEIKDQLYNETEESNDIIYIIERESSDEEEDEKQNVEIVVEQNETLSLLNKTVDIESNETENNYENDGFNHLIESCDTENEGQEQDTNYDITSTDHEANLTIINDKKENSVEPDTYLDNKDVKLFRCHLCPQSFSRMFLLEKHLTLHEKNKNFICTVCRKHFAAKSSLDRHFRIHNGEKPYKCDICGKAFIQSEILKRHRYLHFDKKPFACSQCDQAFIQKNLLHHHIAIKHSNKPVPKMFNCDICPKAFVHSSGLSRHLILHSGIKYSCDYCKKNFTDKSALKRHREIHFKVKSYD